MVKSFYDMADCDVSEFIALTAQVLQADTVPLSAEIVKNVPIYIAQDLTINRALFNEWAWVLGEGPGVLAIRGAYADTEPLDAATDAFNQMIAEEGGGAGDHFAKAGANARIWNAAQKLCLKTPEVAARYFGNPWLSAVSEAWLGPGFQMTAQVNLVYPGGAAQQAHRDYHLGFLGTKAALDFPKHVHHFSGALTLQGAIAHCDMPLESGPTKLLPFSQTYGPGYLAYETPAFRDHFEEAHVQVPLSKGDLLFFNPALFHAAGENRSKDIERMANLVQVSSAFGRAMESMDRPAMMMAVYPALLAAKGAGVMSQAEQEAAIACTAEGYAFPTSLDTDPPLGGLAPRTPQAIMRDALAGGQAPTEFAATLKEAYARRTP